MARLRDELARLKENRRNVDSWHSSSSSSSSEDEESSATSRAKEEAEKNKILLAHTQEELKVQMQVLVQ